MLDKIVLSQDRTKAVMVFTDRPAFTLWHDEGKVLDLVLYFLMPHGTNPDVTWASYMGSLEDTQSIDISKIDEAA